MGRTPGASPSALTQDEAGASDNRLSLDLNDSAFDFTKDWADGQDYTLSNVRVRQLSPGEFEVISAEAGGAAEEEAPDERRGSMGEAAEEAEPNTAATGGAGFRNPAIANIMAKY